MDYIYVVSTFGKFIISQNCSIDTGYIRTICWCKLYEDALKIVLDNKCDIHEGFYTYAVIEKINSSMYPVENMGYKRYFFKWNEEESCYKPAKEIEDAINNNHICPVFSIG